MARGWGVKHQDLLVCAAPPPGPLRGPHPEAVCPRGPIEQPMTQEGLLYLPNVTVQQDGQRIWLGKKLCERYGFSPGDIVDVYLGGDTERPDDVNCEIDDNHRVTVRKKTMDREEIEPGDDIDVHLEKIDQ